MESYQGISVVGGVVAGPVYIIKREKNGNNGSFQIDSEVEWKKIRKAINKSQRQLEILTEEARLYMGNNGASIFEAHQMILMDEEFLDHIRNNVEQEHLSAEDAIQRAGIYFSEMFSAMDMEYMKARASDMMDIAGRLISNLKEEENLQMKNSGPVILVSEYINPSDIFHFGKENVLALVTTVGSSTSHAALLAKSLEIPLIIHIQIDLDELKNGDLAIVDANEGRFYLKPSADHLEKVNEWQRREISKLEELAAFIGQKSMTKDGKEILVCANIMDGNELKRVKEVGSDGIGLFRSEFLFMERKEFPSEEEQFYAYKRLVEKMDGKPVVIRTMDIGSDKQLQYFQIQEEGNPSLGLRGIRISLKYPELFKVQLRALLRAAVYGNLKILYPLISSTEEIDQIDRIIQEAIAELEAEKLRYSVPSQGVMIETPAAVMVSEELAEKVDFFSIGTNDLTQYGLAVDRGNDSVGALYNQRHEGILRMIKMAIDAIHRHGKRAELCGELASDVEMIPRLLEMGVDILSVPSSMVLPLRKKISEL